MVIQRNSFGESSVKLGSRQALVIVAGGNLTEIRPPLALARKWRLFKKWASSEVMIWGIFPHVIYRYRTRSGIYRYRTRSGIYRYRTHFV